MDRERIIDGIVLKTRWSIAENTLFVNMECPRCHKVIENIDAKDHFIQCYCHIILNVRV